MIVSRSDVEALSRLDMGDFAAEVERLIGTETYRKLLAAGKSMREICNDILQMVNDKTTPPCREQMELFKDKAAQC